MPKNYVKAMQCFEKAADQVRKSFDIPCHNQVVLCDIRIMEMAIVG